MSEPSGELPAEGEATASNSHGPRAALATPGQAAGGLVLIALLFFTLAGGLSLLVGMEPALFLAQWIGLFLAVLLLARLQRLDLRQVFFLRKPARRELTAGLFLILGGMPLALFLAWVQGFFMEVPTELLEQLQEMVTADTLPRLLWLLVLLAVTPAVCEEFVFRGFLLSSTERRFSVVPLLLLNGAVFGAFHLNAFRILPTAFLGALLALVVWRTRSIWTGVFMHMMNNAAIVILSAEPFLPLMEGMMEDRPPLLILPLALASLGFGAYLLFSESAEADDAGQRSSTWDGAG